MKKIIFFVLLLLNVVISSAQNQNPKIIYLVGAIATTYQAPNGEYVLEIKHFCKSCGTTGICSVCAGMGGIYISSFGYFQPCISCGGRKICMGCGGQGYIMQQLTSPYPFSEEYVKQSYYSAAAMSRGSSSSSNSRNSSSRSNASDNYIEVIEYAPDYTGNGTKVWCEKCKCYDYRHSHIKKRY